MRKYFQRCPALLISLFIIQIFFVNRSLAQTSIRPFALSYSNDMHGGVTILGNTVLNIMDNGVPAVDVMNETSNESNGVGGIGNSQYGNDQNDMQQVDIDDIATTKNSTAAALFLPSGINTIKFARLYWGGRINSSLIQNGTDTLQKIKIRKGLTGDYTELIAPSINSDQLYTSSTEVTYHTFIDITNFINTNGSGMYSVADVPVQTGVSTLGGNYGGWSMVVVYENSTQPYNSVRLYDGFAQVYASGLSANLHITLTGLNIPANALLSSEAVFGAVCWEGDANLGATNSNPYGDYIKINDVAVSNNANPATNFWNGSITDNGNFVSTKIPDYSNQMGIDIDQVEVGVGYGILPNATSVDISFGTEADMYFPSVFTFQVKSTEPDSSIVNSVKLLSIQANWMNDHTAQIAWSTGSEIDNNYFVVERSEDGKKFFTVGKVVGSGTTNGVLKYYQLNDMVVGNVRVLYYRIKAVDNKGDVSYSSIITLKKHIEISSNEVLVYPNPVSQNSSLVFNNHMNEMGVMNIYNSAGNCIVKKNIALQNGTNSFKIFDDISKPASGDYKIIIEKSSGRLSPISILVN